MKHVLVLSALLLSALSANAGDNGYYNECASASGRTKLVVGEVGGGGVPRTVELTIDGKSYGPAQIGGGGVFETTEGSVTRYTEASHDGTDWVTIQERPVSERLKYRGVSKITILSGLDPRTAKPLAVQINLTCQTVYNPI